MKTYILLFSALLFSSLCGLSKAQSDKPAGAVKLNILTYNIHVGIGMDEKVDLERIAKTIREQNPDLVALQEVDRFADRTQQIDEIAELARLTGMEYAYGKTLNHGLKGEYGIAILSRFPVLEQSYSQLPQLGNREARGVLSVTIIQNNRIIRFACTHFCHESKERRIKQAQKINELFTGFTGDSDSPVIIGGDFNATPVDSCISVLKERWTDATDLMPTFGNPLPSSKLDYIFYYPNNVFRVMETKVIPDSISSDHRPVLSTLEVLLNNNTK